MRKPGAVFGIVADGTNVPDTYRPHAAPGAYVPLRLGQRRHAVDDGRGGAEDEALHLGRVHRAGLRLKVSGL